MFLKRFLFSLSVALTLTTYNSNAQTTSKISGKILNSKNEPLSGVSVTIEGLSTGTSTDVEGNFTVSVPSAKSLNVKISAIGYQDKKVSDITVATGKSEELNIILEEASRKLDNVVVKIIRCKKRIG